MDDLKAARRKQKHWEAKKARKRLRGGKELRRVSDGLVGTVNDADLWEVRLEPEQQVLHFRGFALPEESTLGSHELTNNDKLYLFFKAPWEPDEWEGPKAGGGKEKGGKKK